MDPPAGFELGGEKREFIYFIPFERVRSWYSSCPFLRSYPSYVPPHGIHRSPRIFL